MPKFAVFLWITIFSFSFTSEAAGAQPSEERFLHVHSIAIDPYAIKKEGKFSGIYYELAEQLVAKAGWQREHDVLPYVRIMHEMKAGKPILTIMFKYDHMLPYVDYIYPLPALENVVIAKTGTNYASVESLHGKTLAYLRGAKFSEAIDNNPEITKHVVTNFKQGLQMLQQGRVDGIIGPLQPLLSSAKKLNFPKDFFGTPLVVSKRTPWLQVTKNSIEKGELEKLKIAFTDIMEGGTYQEIKSRY